MQEIAIPIRNEWPDKQTYEEIITKPYRTIIKIGDENLTKTHLHKSKRLLTIECLNDYKNALGKTINLFKDPNTKDTVINYFEQNNCSDTEEAILRKETSNLIRDFSRNIKKMRDISLEKLNKAEEEANKEKFFTRKSKKRDLEKARKAVEKAYNNMKKIKIDIKETGREKGIYSPKTIANFIKKIFNILNEAQELLGQLLEQYEGNSSHLIDGYKDLSTKELKDMKKKLESNNSKESFGWNIENLEKAFKEIDRASSTMQNSKSKKGRKNIREIIKTANIRIDILVTELADEYNAKNLKQISKNVNNNLTRINDRVNGRVSILEQLFPLGVREMARIYLTLLIATKLKPIYYSIQDNLITMGQYENKVNSSIEATSMLSIAGGMATTLGFAGIVGVVLVATIGYAIIGAIRAVNAGSDLDDSERALEETINWTNPETNPSQSKGKGDFANLPNSITDTQVMVNTLLTDVDLKETEAEQLKKSGKQTEAEILLAEATEKKNKARLFNAQLISKLTKDVSYRINEVKNFYEKLRKIITQLFYFKFDEKKDAMEQIESFVKMMKEEADTSKDICIEIKASESVIDQAKKVGVYTEELEEEVKSLTKAQKEVSAKATEVKESLPETIKKMIVGKYSKMYDERNAIAKKLSESMASIGEYSNKLNELEDLDKLSTLGNYEHSLVRLEKISNLEIDRTLYETENYISRAIKMNEQLAPITTITDNLVEIGIFKKISDIYETYDLSNLPDEASKKIDEVKEAMVKKVSGTTAILKDSNENLQRNLIPSLNDIKKTFEKNSQYTALQNASEKFDAIKRNLSEMNGMNKYNLTAFLILEAVKTEINKELTEHLSDTQKTLHESLENANNLVKKIQEIIPKEEEKSYKKNSQIKVLSKKLLILQEAWKKVLEELEITVGKYHLIFTKERMLQCIEEIKRKQLYSAINLQILIDKIVSINKRRRIVDDADIVACIKWSYDNDYNNRVTGNTDNELPPEAIAILKNVKKLLIAIEKYFRVRMVYDKLSGRPPYNGESYPMGCISNEEYVNKFADFLSYIDGLIKELKTKVVPISDQDRKTHKLDAKEKRTKAFKEFQAAFNSVSSEVKSLLKTPFDSVNSKIEAQENRSINDLVVNLEKIATCIHSTAESYENDKNTLETLKNLAHKTNELIIVIEEDLRYRIENKKEQERNNTDSVYIENLENALKEADKTLDTLDELLLSLEEKEEKEEKEKQLKIKKSNSKKEKIKITERLRESLERMEKDYAKQYKELDRVLTKIPNTGEDIASLFNSISDIEEFVNALYLEAKHDPTNKEFLSALENLAIIANKSLCDAVIDELNYELTIEALSIGKNNVKYKYKKELDEFNGKIKKIEQTVQQLTIAKDRADEILKEARMQQSEEDLETMLEEEDLRKHLGDTSKKK